MKRNKEQGKIMIVAGLTIILVVVIIGVLL
jgi:hypothetical protein